jgi:hypothetical protein
VSQQAQLARTEATGARKIEIGFPEERKCPVKRPCPMRVCNKERGRGGGSVGVSVSSGPGAEACSQRVPQCRILRVSRFETLYSRCKTGEGRQKRNSAGRTNGAGRAKFEKRAASFPLTGREAESWTIFASVGFRDAGERGAAAVLWEMGLSPQA